MVQPKQTKVATMLAGLNQLALLVMTFSPLQANAATCADKTIDGGIACGSSTGAGSDLLLNVRTITNTLLIGVGIVSVIMLIIGGFRYAFSQGNEKAVSGAKDTIIYAIIGLIVAIVAFAVVNFVIGQFSRNPT